MPDWLNAIGRDDEWFTNALAMEALYRQTCDRLLSRQAREHEVAAMRLPLTRFELETMEVDSLDAAREALLCVRDDGMSMTEVAEEGRYPYRHAEILLEDLPEDLQQKFFSVSAATFSNRFRAEMVFTFAASSKKRSRNRRMKRCANARSSASWNATSPS